MKILGYSLTWRTHRFLRGGCRQTGLFGHTNGDGDFVLFDSLGWPWPIHECYVRRFELDLNAAIIRVHGTRDVAVEGEFGRTWQTITTVSADLERHSRAFSIIGTITNIDK